MLCVISLALLVCAQLGQAARPAMEQVGSLPVPTHLYQAARPAMEQVG